MSKQTKGGFEFKGGFSAGTGGAGSKESDLVITNALGNMKVKPNEAEDGDDDEDDEAMATLPRAVLKRVLALRNMHSDMEALEKEYKAERIALEQKYCARRDEMYAARHRVITGEVEPEVDTTQLVDAPDEASAEEENVKGVPDFWSQCLLQHPSTAEIIVEEDMPLLEKLTNITCTYDADYTSFTLYFHFAENDYFTNTVLTKKYGVTPDLLDDQSPALTLCEGSEINWKPGKNLTVTEIKKKQKAKSGKHKGQVRTVVTQEPKRSFFNYFATPNPDDEDEDEDEEDDEDGPIKLDTEADYDIGHSIRTAIIPEAIMWYTGEADDAEDDDEDDEDEDDEDEEDDEEDDEEEEEEAPKKNNKKKTGGSAANKGGFAAPTDQSGGAAGEQPECKQN